MTLKRLLLKVVRMLNRLQLEYMLTGGIAANYYGSIRATQDIDICLRISEKDVPKLVDRLNRLGLEKLKVDDVIAMVKTSNRFFCYEPRKLYRIDFWLAKTEFEKQALGRRIKGRVNGLLTYFISIEDLIVNKLLQNRGRDIDDIRVMIEVNRKAKQLDVKRLKSIAKELGVSPKRVEDLLEAAE